MATLLKTPDIHFKLPIPAEVTVFGAAIYLLCNET